MTTQDVHKRPQNDFKMLSNCPQDAQVPLCSSQDIPMRSPRRPKVSQDVQDARPEVLKKDSGAFFGTANCAGGLENKAAFFFLKGRFFLLPETPSRCLETAQDVTRRLKEDWGMRNGFRCKVLKSVPDAKMEAEGEIKLK